jgi:hypothetical protein
MTLKNKDSFFKALLDILKIRFDVSFDKSQKSYCFIDLSKLESFEVAPVELVETITPVAPVAPVAPVELVELVETSLEKIENCPF